MKYYFCFHMHALTDEELVLSCFQINDDRQLCDRDDPPHAPDPLDQKLG